MDAAIHRLDNAATLAETAFREGWEAACESVGDSRTGLENAWRDSPTRQRLADAQRACRAASVGRRQSTVAFTFDAEGRN